MKRTYLGVLHRVQKKMLVEVELTPARFDVLYILLERHGEMWQSTLRKKLGVCAVTVIRMVKALEEKGCLTRVRSQVDRRQMALALTDLGRALVRRVLKTVIKRRWPEMALSKLFTYAWWDPDETFAALDSFDSRCLNARYALADSSANPYPSWHPDV